MMLKRATSQGVFAELHSSARVDDGVLLQGTIDVCQWQLCRTT